MLTSDQLAAFARDYWDLALLMATWLGILLIAVRRRRDWKRKRFTEQVNFSLNLINDGHLHLRTLLESSARAVWLNEYGVKQVHNLCEHTTLEQPFLHMSNAKDMDYLKRAVLNEMSEQFATTYMAQALGVPIRTASFTFGITWERYGNLRTQKLRVMIIRTDLLDEWFASDEKAKTLKVMHPAHEDRITTLRAMYILRHSKSAEDRNTLGEIVLGVPVTP